MVQCEANVPPMYRRIIDGESEMDLTQVLAFAVENQASDVHLTAEMPPLVRIDGEIKSIEPTPLAADTVRAMVTALMEPAQAKRFAQHHETDFSLTVDCGAHGLARFRVNAFMCARGPAAVFRVIPAKIMTLESLQAPPIFATLTQRKTGLVLVTGPTGSGKSSTLAAMVDHINTHRRAHILTIEDPIEFIHTPKQALINQRELGQHTRSFQAALRSALRADPDVILIGEMRDLATIRLALTAAETGHLVLATLHTASAAKSVDRIMDVFAPGEKAMIAAMLAESLAAIIAQRLLPATHGGRLAAWEILLGTPPVRNLIREHKTPQLVSVMQTSRAAGMLTADQCLSDLHSCGMITREVAREHASEPSRFAAAE